MDSNRKVALFEKGLEQGAAITVPGPDGEHRATFTLEQFLAWAEDETGYWTREYGCTREQLADWYERGGGGGGKGPGPRCIATTRQRRRCKKTIEGHSECRSFAEFVQLDNIGGYCIVHEGHVLLKPLSGRR
ncbi:MAG: hypothetical protein WD672_15425 [Woeseia sp.]